MLARYAVVLLVCWSPIVLGQVTGRFYLQKETFAERIQGRPLFLLLGLPNPCLLRLR